jgi:kynureninase
MADKTTYRDQFHIPQHKGADAIYLCGNSLGLMPKKAREYVNAELEDWASLGVEGHLHARHPWLPYHEFLTAQMAELIGAKPVEVVVMNSLTVNVHVLFTTFYRPVKNRRKIIVESDIFPSDLYAVQSQIEVHGGTPATDLIFWKPRSGEQLLRYEDLENLVEQHRDDLALIFIGGVNYYTGQSFDLGRITQLGHDLGIPVGFDLAHGAGNINYHLHASGADFAAWCGYKYLNSGPGGLSGVFIHERHAHDFTLPRFKGWWGHNKETRFGMRDPFDPLPGAEGWQLSNPPILPMAALRASLEIFTDATMDVLRERSMQLTGRMEKLLHALDHSELQIFTPTDPAARGCQLSLFLHSSGRALFDFITARGVIADWREPNVIRVAPVPLYNTMEDVEGFVQIVGEGLEEAVGR